MAKCVKCGKGFLTRGRIKLANADICFSCFDALGFDHKTGIYSGNLYKWEDIKDGYEAMMARKHDEQRRKDASALGVTVEQLRSLSDMSATDMEKNIMAKICDILRDEDRDTSVIRADLGGGGSVMLSIDGTIIISFKADEGVKWIRFENEQGDKIRIGGPARLNSMAERIVTAYDSAE